MKGKSMAVSYNGLWKMLIDKKMYKKDLAAELNISSATMAKMGKGEKMFPLKFLRRFAGTWIAISGIS